MTAERLAEIEARLNAATAGGLEQWERSGDTVLFATGVRVFLGAAKAVLVSQIPNDLRDLIAAVRGSAQSEGEATEFPERMVISEHGLDPSFARRDGDRIHFTVAHGEAVYVIDGEGPHPEMLALSRLYVRMDH